MSELDELARASRERGEAVRYQVTRAVPNGPARIEVSAGVSHEHRMKSPFAIGFYVTLGVIAAIFASLVMCAGLGKIFGDAEPSHPPPRPDPLAGVVVNSGIRPGEHKYFVEVWNSSRVAVSNVEVSVTSSAMPGFYRKVVFERIEVGQKAETDIEQPLLSRERMSRDFPTATLLNGVPG